MAVDLSIEVFSVDLFRNLWYELGFSEILLPRFKSYDEVTNLDNTCSEAVCHAIMRRRSFFTHLLWGDVYFEYEEYSKTDLDFYLYLQNNMTRFLPYSELNIFDKIFMACAVILEMSRACALYSNNMYTYNAPLCMAMYFDNEYKDEFYDEGGWKELEIHANSYKARVLVCSNNNDDSFWDIISAYNDAINVDYSYDFAHGVYRDEILRGKASCQQCLPLFHVVRMLSGEGKNDECMNAFQLTEGYLQLILRMLTHEELKNVKDFLQKTDFDAFSETVNIGCDNVKATEKEKTEVFRESECQIQNTHQFLARLFASNEDSNDDADQCMFCGCDMNTLSKDLEAASDCHVELINSIFYNTQSNVNPEDESAKGSFEANSSLHTEKEDSVNEVLRLFFSLGVEPLTSHILANLRKNEKNESKSNVEIQTSKALDSDIKGIARKKKSRKSKNKNCN